MCHPFRNKGQTNSTFIILYALPRLPRASGAFVQSCFCENYYSCLHGQVLGYVINDIAYRVQ